MTKKQIHNVVYDDDGNESADSENVKKESALIFETLGIEKEFIMEMVGGLYDDKRIRNMYKITAAKAKKLFNLDISGDLDYKLLFILRSFVASVSLSTTKAMAVVLDNQIKKYVCDILEGTTHDTDD